MNYVIAVSHKVDELQQAQTLLIDALEFSLREQGEDFALLENGALNIRLIQQPKNAGHPLHLDVASKDLDAAVNFYAQHGFRQSEDVRWVHPFRQEIYLQGPDNIQLTVFREYNEDELGILPELETSLDWHDDALELTKRLIKSVPLSFRDNARHKIIAMAEADAIVAGLVEVDQDHAVRAIIKVTPDFQHQGLKDAMTKNGLEPKEFFADD